MKNNYHKSKDERGIALVLSMMVLASIIGLVLVSADASFSVLRSSQSIGLSEKALFAAESGVEITLYDIIVNQNGLNLADLSAQPMTNVDATWGRQVRVATSTPGLCGAPLPKPVCSINNDTINSGNSLFVTLQDGEHFQVDLDIVGAQYPDTVAVDVSTAGTSLVLRSSTTQTRYTNGIVTIPPTGVLNPIDGWVFSLYNNTGSARQYEVTVSGGANELPLGLKITGIGTFRGTQRTIDFIRPSWLIY